jgi:hypothetical protein
MTNAQTAALGLVPAGLGKLSAVPALKALGDGSATIAVPLKAGDYKLDGVSFTVKPGTVAHVQVQVKNGNLVSVNKQGAGTRLDITPPLDLPLWITGQGAALEGDAAKQKIDLELGGMFDLHFKAKSLSEMLTAPPAAKPSAATELLGKLADLTHATVDAKVTMRAAKLDLGGAQVAVDPSTVFSLKGTGTGATLQGHVQLDDFGLDQGGVRLRGSGGQADLAATISRTAEGAEIDTTLSNVKLTVDSLQSSQPSALVPGSVDRVNLGKTEISSGSLGFKTRLGLDGMKLTGVHQDGVTLKLRGSGVVNDAQLTVKDDKDTATFGLAGSFEGSVETGPGGVKIDAQISHAHVDVGDLQETMSATSVSIEHARADGDLHVKTDAAAGQLSIDGQAQNIDILVDDFKGTSGAGAFKADLGRTAVSGGGQFHVGKDGVRADGHLKGSAAFDSASYGSGKAGVGFGASTISGDVTHLNFGKAGAELRLDNVTADINVTRATMAMGSTTMSGAGNLRGTGTVVLDAKGFSLQGKSQIGLKLDDGKIHSSTMELDLAKGSNAELKLTDLTLGKVTHVKLDAGSTLDAVLDSGSLTVAGQTVQLAKGGRAQIAVKNVAYTTGGKPDLRGSVKLDARVSAANVHLTAVDQPGIKVHPTSADGRVKVSIDDVHLSGDKLSFAGGQVALDVNVGKYIGAAGHGQPSVGSLQTPVAALSVDEVKAKSAAQIAGVETPAAAAGQPLDALKLLKQGQLKLDVPLSGALRELGMDVVKFPPGSKLDLALCVVDGKVVAGDSKASLSGGVRALGVEVTGAHLDKHLEVHVDLKIAGRSVSLPLPGVHVPADMNALAELARPSAKSTGSGIPGYLDLSHSQLDVTNATFAAGRISLPGGSVNIAEGSKLSFHGTPLAGHLVGNVGLDAVNMGLPQLALKGSAGRADLSVSYRRDGDKAVVDAQLTNLGLTSDYATSKGAEGDYFSLGAGRINGGTVSVRSNVQLTAAGLPRTDVLPSIESGAVSVSNFSGDLKSARISSTVGGATGVSELGKSHVDGAVAYALGKGLTIKATVDRLDAHLTGVHLAQQGRQLELEHARLQGKSGRIELGDGRMVLDAQQLAWDVTAKELGSALPQGQLKAGQVHITGEGRFTYDSRKELEVAGTLHIDGGISGSTTLGGTGTKHVSISRTAGVVVR